MPELQFDKDGQITSPYPALEIRFDQEVEEVWSFTDVRVPDPGWKHFDSNGHAHAWNKDELPTLDKVKTGTIVYGDEIDGYDEVDQTEYRCRVCEEAVEPGYRTEQQPQYVTGPPRYTLVVAGWEYHLDDDDVGPLMEIFRRAGVIK